MIVVAPVLVSRDQVKDKQHLTWTTKVLMAKSGFKSVLWFTSATHFECPQHHEIYEISEISC